MYALVHFAVAIVAYQLLIARRMVRLLFLIIFFKKNPSHVSETRGQFFAGFFFSRIYPFRYGISHNRLNTVNCCS